MKCVKNVVAWAVLFMSMNVWSMEQKQQPFAVPCINSNNRPGKKISVPAQLLLLIEERMPCAFGLMELYRDRYDVDKFSELIQQGVCTALSPQTGFHMGLLAIKSKTTEVDWSFIETTIFEFYLKQLICKFFKHCIDEKVVNITDLYTWMMKDIRYQIKHAGEDKKFLTMGSISQPALAVSPTRFISASSSANHSSQAYTTCSSSYLIDKLLPADEMKE